MDTYMTIQCTGVDAKKAVSACKKEIVFLDSVFDPNNTTGDVYKINHRSNDTVSVLSDTLFLLDCSKRASIQTNGAFDITVRPLIELWGFDTDSPSVPSSEKIHECLPLKGESSYCTDTDKVILNEDTTIDLGGIAKGYCSDKLREILGTYNLTGAVLSLGGNILAYGTKPDGSKWNVAVMDPNSPESFAGILKVQDTFIVTSGSYQRCFEENGKTYHHILNPKTGYPAETGLLSVTVVSKNGTYADALSTAFFVLGYEKSVECLKHLSPDVKPDGVLFITDDKIIYLIGDIDFNSNGDYTCIKETI